MLFFLEYILVAGVYSQEKKYIVEPFLQVGVNSSILKISPDRKHFYQKAQAGYSIAVGINFPIYKGLMASLGYSFDLANYASGKKYMTIDPPGEVKSYGTMINLFHKINIAMLYKWKKKKLAIEPGIGFNLAWTKYGNEWGGVFKGGDSYFDTLINQFVISSVQLTYPPQFRKYFALSIEAGLKCIIQSKYIQPYVYLKYEQGLLSLTKWNERIEIYNHGSLASGYNGTFAYKGTLWGIGMGVNISVQDMIDKNHTRTTKFRSDRFSPSQD